MNPKSIPVLDFSAFLESFPEAELPITLSTDLAVTFSKSNDPLSVVAVRQYIGHTGATDDEFTEYVACFQVPDTFEFQAIVYWRAGLMDYQYILATYDKNGQPIDRATLAGTNSDGDTVTESVAVFEDDWVIRVVTGARMTNGRFDPANSSVAHLELLPDGTIKREN